jgi:DNA-binding response OmpR family regulator
VEIVHRAGNGSGGKMNDKTEREALLVLHIDGQLQQTWSLAQAVTRIGRWEDNDIVIADRWISRHHAEIRRQGNRYLVADLDSKNGLFLNGQRLGRPIALEDGDRIQIAPRCLLVFVDAEATAPVLQQQQRGVMIDASACRVWVNGHELEPSLSSAQFALLQMLSDQPGHVFSRDELIAHIWPDEDPAGISDEAVNSLVRRLRRRLMHLDPDHRYIFAIRGHGFKFDQP